MLSCSIAIDECNQVSTPLPPLCSILLDETTSCSKTKELIVYLKLVIEGEAHGMLARLQTVRDGRSLTIFQAVQDLLRELGFEASQVVGFGSDGASAMLGR